jgi:hypothetical protein
MSANPFMAKRRHRVVVAKNKPVRGNFSIDTTAHPSKVMLKGLRAELVPHLTRKLRN